MLYSQPVTEIIKRRSSRRSYVDKPIEGEMKQKLEAFLSAQQTGPFNTETRFILAAASTEDKDALKGLGTYGFIKGAPGFIIGTVKQSENNLEDYGYLMEKIILFATHLGLGTCWLGGSFNKSNFSKKISAKADESVPAVCSVGYVREKRSKRDSLIRWGVGAKKRLQREDLFYEKNFETPLSKHAAGDYEIPLEMVRLGPSASNKQPWRILKEKDKPVFHLFLQRAKGYDKQQKAFKMADIQRLDMGIAMCHFELTAHDLGLKGEWRIETPPDAALPERTEYAASWVG